MMTYEEALAYALEGEAIFLTGSGFSIGARNALQGEDSRLLVGSALANKLAVEVDMEANTPLDIIVDQYIDYFGERKLMEYLVEHYTVDSYEDYYKSFARVKDLKVYTTNYDDLMEKVCADCGDKRVKGYSIDSNIEKINKNRLIMHLNGYIKDLEGNTIPETFKISTSSYDMNPFYGTTWHSYLVDELYSAKVIFIIGLSFKSDLDLRRVIAPNELKDRVFIIENEGLKSSDRRFLEKYGRVLLCGVEGFCHDLARIPLPEDNQDRAFYFKSFQQAKRHENIMSVQDRDVFDMFFKGNEQDSLYVRDDKRKFTSLVNRDRLSEVVDGLRNGKSFILYSDLGNGKSVFVKQVIDLLPEMDFYYARQNINQKIQKEVKQLCKDSKPKVIICDPANLYLDMLSKFAVQELDDVRFLLVMRASMFDNCYNDLYAIVDRMNGTKFEDAICLDVLTTEELEELDDLIVRHGFYGERMKRDKNRRMEMLKKECRSNFQSILLTLFKSEHIIRSFDESLAEVKSNSRLKSILALAFVGEILELDLSYQDYRILLNINDVERIIRSCVNCAEILDAKKGTISVKSSVIAKELLASDRGIFTTREVLDVLVGVMHKLDNMYEGSRKYRNALVNLVSCSYISYVFSYNVNSTELVDYYEKAKELNFCKNNLFFWEQYAIVCVNIKNFDRAERYFETAYSLARARGRGFSTYQIDNHYAKCILEKQIYYRKADDSLDVFIKAHSLINGNSEMTKNQPYYKYRVARSYKEYYETFAIYYEHEDREKFLVRCQEMYTSLKNYIRGIDPNRIRDDVMQCERGLRFILENENKRDVKECRSDSE